MIDVVNLKQNIYSGRKIENILIKLGCHNIKIEQDGKLYTASLPNGDNPRSVQVQNNKYLNTCIRSKGIENIDIFDLVSYIKFGELTNDDMKYSRKLSIEWINNNLEESLKNYCLSDFSWYKEVVKPKNKNINKNILNNYFHSPHKLWVDEGINCDTQNYFQICYNLDKNQIVIPIFDVDGELIGIKARNLDIYEYGEKYIYLYPCNAKLNLYGLYIAKKYIKKDNSVIIFESEKSVMKAFQYGFRNSIALGCKDLSTTQLSLLKEYINNDTKIYLALDKDVYFSKDEYDYHHLKSLAKMFNNNNVFALVDNQGILDVKDAPIDKGLEAFSILLQNAKNVNTLIDKSKESINDKFNYVDNTQEEDDDEW